MKPQDPCACDHCKATFPHGFLRYHSAEQAAQGNPSLLLCPTCALRGDAEGRVAADLEVLFEQIELVFRSDPQTLWGEARKTRDLMCRPGRLAALLRQEVRRAS